MDMYTVIPASKEQAVKLFEKHCKPGTLGIRRILTSSFSYDSEDNIGFVTLRTRTGKTISYQLRGKKPCFVEFTGFGNIRYDVAYPEALSEDLYLFLQEWGLKAESNFWKGGEI